MLLNVVSQFWWIKDTIYLLRKRLSLWQRTSFHDVFALERLFVDSHFVIKPTGFSMLSTVRQKLQYDHSGLYKFSVNESDRFWGAVARQRLSWISPFHTVQNCDFSQGKIKWFEGGKLNVSGKITFSPQNIQYVRNIFNCFCTAISKPYSS